MTNPSTDSKGKYVIVEKGDTLSAIAKKHLGSASKYQQLATWNNISNPNLIYVGQKVYITKPSSSSTTTSTSNTNKVTFNLFGLQSNADNTLFVTWTWAKEKETLKYLVEWSYHTGDGVWFIGDSGENTVDSYNRAASRQDLYTIPSNAKKVRVRVRPVSKTYKKDKKETTYWTGAWSSYKTHTVKVEDTLATPDTPSVTINKYKLTASLENITIEGATQIQFQIYKNDGSSVYKTGVATITATKSASWSYTVAAGAEYKVRCRAKKGSLYSEWSLFSDGVTTIPTAPTGITELKALSETSVSIKWSAVSNTDFYDIEYTQTKGYFDSAPDEVSTTTIDAKSAHNAQITGLESGKEYFFRLRARNSQGESAWTAIKSIKLGKAPSAPTTWSSTTTCITGEELILYWVHNSEDGSSQTKAELEIIVGSKKNTYTINNSTDEDEKDKTSFYKINTTSYTEGTQIKWRVRTAGIIAAWGDWSTQRTVDIYAPPTLDLDVTDAKGHELTVLESFPFNIRAVPGPDTQTPLSYHVSIVANSSYETVDNVGNVKFVSQGDEVYSEYYDISQTLKLELTPSSIDLENGVSYTVVCVVSMNSGLTATETCEFEVIWTDEQYTPNAEIGYDAERYTTHIRPYCVDHQINYYRVSWSSDSYTKTTTKFNEDDLDPVYTTTDEQVYVGILSKDREVYYCQVYVDANDNPIDPVCYEVKYGSNVYTKTSTVLNIKDIGSVYTKTGDEVLMGITSGNVEVLYCISEENKTINDITLSVYRREYDGRFVEIASGLKNTSNTFTTDPHPALDYARYRVVAISDVTGAVSYYDVPGYPIGEVAAIIQWDEEWSNFDTTENAELEQPAWTGSLIRLPYNLDVSDDNSIDVAHVHYAGRQHPVSYYGTQLGTTSTWRVEIDKDDQETLYALRRLAIWMGDVYVREPSGSGYWATVKVSFSQTHREVTIPVSLDITRVEGGV